MRSNLQRVLDATGIRPTELIEVEFPAGMEHVWRWFGELSRTRSVGMIANPISYQEIMAWSIMTGAEPTPFEVGCLTALDATYLAKGEK